MNTTPAVRRFWEAFCSTQAADLTPRFYEACYFGDSEPLAHELAALVLAGTKRATASLLWSLEAEGQRPPSPGDLSVVTDWQGEPLCIIETRTVAVRAFDEVDEAFAATEGEGDRSLRYWREAHWAYYGRECQRIGKAPDPRMLVVCEEFAVVYRVAGAPPPQAPT